MYQNTENRSMFAFSASLLHSYVYHVLHFCSKCDFPSDSQVTCYSTAIKPSIIKPVESESHLLNLTPFIK